MMQNCWHQLLGLNDGNELPKKEKASVPRKSYKLHFFIPHLLIGTALTPYIRTIPCINDRPRALSLKFNIKTLIRKEFNA